MGLFYESKYNTDIIHILLKKQSEVYSKSEAETTIKNGVLTIVFNHGIIEESTTTTKGHFYAFRTDSYPTPISGKLGLKGEFFTS